MQAVTLGIDTAGPVIGAALWSAEGPGRAWSAAVVRGADGLLLPAIVDLLASIDADPDQQLVCIAVAHGPGAFTGLRVGVATALGLAMARGLPVAAVSSLAARAALCGAPRCLPLLDARKGKLYAGLYDASQAVPAPLGPEVDAPLEALLPAPPFVAIGEGASLHAAAITAAGGQIAADPTRCAASEVARLGAVAEWMDPAAFELHYIRDADAKLPAPGAGRIGA